ncbi:transcription elongation factor SPT5 [Striga asiatica]|uniref:Transcription elongation factor SPT5 n=1 Tax=Striga asiatica TaxID=4170 RepID=A0A5A7QV78_STRAF|nr:transcription elongation factor SPT5 [Striga asiatica]
MPRAMDESESEYEEETAVDRGAGCGRAKRKRDGEEEGCGGGSGGRRRRGKRAMKSVSDFFEEEAYVDSEEEEEDGEEDFIDAADDMHDNDDDGRTHHRAPLLARDHDEEEDVEEIERMVHERYSKSSFDYDGEATALEHPAQLSSIWDPKLWTVKCAIGREKELAACLLQKITSKGPELKITSAIALDHLKGYIYIDAYKEAHVREAVKGMHNIYPQKIGLVPINEMADVFSLSTQRKSIDISMDMWVRVRSGLYKGDLAKVVDVDTVRQRATVKLIPRIDLPALANKLEGRKVPKRNTFNSPARFMNIDEARLLNIHVGRKRDQATGDYFDKIDGMIFKDGFLYKKLSLKALSTQDVEPTFDELEKFGWPSEKSLAIRDNELCKHFERGDHVTVVSGATKGVTGLVVSFEGHAVNIASDITKEVYCVSAVDVVESSEASIGVTHHSNYELHDLVLLDDNSFGMIISVEGEAFQILKGVPRRPDVAVVRLREIKSKIYKQCFAEDCYMNTLSVKDSVKFLKGQKGPVEHIYRGILFIYDRNHHMHYGYICVKSESCVVVGGGGLRANDDINDNTRMVRFPRLRTSFVPQSPLRPPRGDPMNYASGTFHNVPRRSTFFRIVLDASGSFPKEGVDILTKTWAVQCEFGREREAVILLMQKSGLAATFNKMDVEQAVRPIKFLNANKVSLVPYADMRDMLKIRDQEEPSVGAWVRVKQGSFTGTLGRVAGTPKLVVDGTPKSAGNENPKLGTLAGPLGRVAGKSAVDGNLMLVTLDGTLERIAGNSKSTVDENPKLGGNSKLVVDGNPKMVTLDGARGFYNVTVIGKVTAGTKRARKSKPEALPSSVNLRTRGMGVDPVCSSCVEEVLGHQMAMDFSVHQMGADLCGLLSGLLWVASKMLPLIETVVFELRMLEVENPNPTLDELDNFQKAGLPIKEDDIVRALAYRLKGQKVRAVSGDHAIGTVDKIERGMVHVSAPGHPNQIILPVESVRKVYPIGSEVKVCQGSYAGAGGTVISNFRNHVVVLNHATSKQMSIFLEFLDST